jgi:RNA-directed DNA polymerase
MSVRRGLKQTTRQLAFDFGEAESHPSMSGEGLAPLPARSRASTLATDLMAQVVDLENVRSALKRVRANRGKPGIDGLTVGQLTDWLREHWRDLRQSLLDGTYTPQPVKRVELAKPDGGVRLLGIPTVVDRFIQQAILQVLQPLYDPTFSPHSYGFRPRRSAHQAVAAARQHVADGCGWVVDLDLEKFFDRVNHDLLMGRLARRIGDRTLLRLIRRYLEAGVLLNGVVVSADEGTPQGGPLSPLLANILLDDLDKELERRGHRFCRYADDCNIYVRSRRAGERVMASVSRFVEQKLKLKVNAAKSAVARPAERKFLGFRILGQQNARLGLAPQTIQRFKDRVRKLTKRNRGVSLSRVLQELRTYTDGWVAYYWRCQDPRPFAELDGWMRRRIRCYVWKQWRRPRTRYRELTRLGVPPWRARMATASNMGPWRAARSYAMNQGLNCEWLEALGYHSILKRRELLAVL